eukprot:scaffold6145_cov102-Isochrysis_galbana.AAC.5
MAGWPASEATPRRSGARVSAGVLGGSRGASDVSHRRMAEYPRSSPSLSNLPPSRRRPRLPTSRTRATASSSASSDSGASCGVLSTASCSAERCSASARATANRSRCAACRTCSLRRNVCDMSTSVAARVDWRRATANPLASHRPSSSRSVASSCACSSPKLLSSLWLSSRPCRSTIERRPRRAANDPGASKVERARRAPMISGDAGVGSRAA